MPSKPKKPKQHAHMGLYRAQLACSVGKNALNRGGSADGIPAIEYAVYNLLCAVDEIATAMMEERERGQPPAA